MEPVPLLRPVAWQSDGIVEIACLIFAVVLNFAAGTTLRSGWATFVEDSRTLRLTGRFIVFLLLPSLVCKERCIFQIARIEKELRMLVRVRKANKRDQ